MYSWLSVCEIVLVGVSILELVAMSGLLDLIPIDYIAGYLRFNGPLFYLAMFYGTHITHGIRIHYVPAVLASALLFIY